MIENVEGLRPKLHTHLLRDTELLGQRRVQIPQTRPNKGAAPRVTESPGRWHQESAGIEPLTDLTQNDRSLEFGIAVGHIGNQGVAAARTIGTNLRREGEPALNV